MLNFIILLAFTLFFFDGYFTSKQIRESLIKALIIIAVAIVFGTEFLNVCFKLDLFYVLSFWVLVIAFMGFRLIKHTNKKEKVIELIEKVKQESRGKGLFFIPIFIILSITLFLALISPVNNTDSLTYHLSRIMYWLQNEHLTHFATNNHRQVAYNIFSEFVILHLYVLGKSDFAANLVQWFSFLGGIAACSLLIKQLGGSIKTQWFGALIVATIPMIVLQATSTQNDLVVSFFVVCGVYFSFKYVQEFSLENSIYFGLNLGLAELTKGTGYIFLFPFCLWLAFRVLLEKKWWKSSKIWTGLILIVMLSVAINLGYYARNWVIFHDPLGHASDRISLENHSPAALISNITRQLSLHIGMHSPGNIWNNFWMNILLTLHDFLGISISDPLTTFGEDSVFKIPRFSTTEDFSGNFLHFLLIIFVSFFYFLKAKKQQTLSLFWFACVLGFIMFCALLRFQLFGSRLHSPFFLLISCFCALVIAERKVIVKPVVIVLSLATLPFLLLNFQKPILSFHGLTMLAKKFVPLNEKSGALALYQKKSILDATYQDVLTHEGLDIQAADFLATNEIILKNHFKSVGLELLEDDKDYLMLRVLIPEGIEVRQIAVKGILGKLESKTFLPEAIVSSRSTAQEIQYHEHIYQKISSGKYLSIYKRQ